MSMKDKIVVVTGANRASARPWPTKRSPEEPNGSMRALASP
jgi:hypothetical protein